MRRPVELMMMMAENVFAQGGHVKVYIAGTHFGCRQIVASSDQTSLKCILANDAEAVIDAAAVLAMVEDAESYP